MTTNIAQNITTLKKINIHKETLSYRNHGFHCVGFWGKVRRVFFCFILCKNTFKDCDPKFITDRLVGFYNKNVKRMNEGDRRLILKKIKLYARNAKTKTFLSKIKKIEKPISKKTIKVETPKEPSKITVVSSTTSIKGGESDQKSELKLQPSQERSDTSSTKGDESDNELDPKSGLNSKSNKDSAEVEGESETESSEIDESTCSYSSNDEAENGWKDVLSDLRKGKMTGEELLKYFKTADVSYLSTKRAVKIYAAFMAKCNTIAEFNVMNFDILQLFNKKQKGAIFKYVIRGFTRSDSPVYKGTWHEVINYLKIQLAASDSVLQTIVAKDTKDITCSEALEVAKWLFKQNEDLAKQFTAKLNPEQRKEIIKANLVSEAELLITSCSQDNSPDLPENFDTYLDTSAKIEEDLPNNLEELWVNFFLGKELKQKVLLAVVKKIMLNDYIHNEETREAALKVLREFNASREAEGNDNYKKNMQNLRSLATEIQCASNKPYSLILHAYIIPFLTAIEPEHASNYAIDKNEAM